jgi:hypothetical protein
LLNNSSVHILPKCTWNIFQDRFVKVAIIESIFFGHSGMKLKTNNGSKTGKFTKWEEFNNMLLFFLFSFAFWQQGITMWPRLPPISGIIGMNPYSWYYNTFLNNQCIKE